MSGLKFSRCGRYEQILQDEHHFLLKRLQGAEQGGLDLVVVLLMVNLSGSNRQHILVVQLVEFDRGLHVSLLGLVSLFICTGEARHT